MGILSAGQWAIVGLILTLWLASMGAAWKVATLLASIAGELRELREHSEVLHLPAHSPARRLAPQ